MKVVKVSLYDVSFYLSLFLFLKTKKNICFFVVLYFFLCIFVVLFLSICFMFAKNEY